ncbi:hypothetical protein B0H14DRAFT_3438554 [Mycena olivaceomarginata]|nr:hypothetical protein B0H14DRAFT_3438554 [Mycena olivaceomarginata]
MSYNYSVLSGGTGGQGGPSKNKGGGGGLGEAPQISAAEARRYNEINGTSVVSAAKVAKEASRAAWAASARPAVREDAGRGGWEDRSPRPAPHDSEVLQTVPAQREDLATPAGGGVRDGGALLDVDDVALRNAGFKGGQIAEVRKALKAFVISAQ